MQTEVQEEGTPSSSSRPSRRPGLDYAWTQSPGGGWWTEGTFLYQVLEFLDTALPKDSLPEPDSETDTGVWPQSQALHPTFSQLAWGGAWGVLWGVKPAVSQWGANGAFLRLLFQAPNSNSSPVSCLHPPFSANLPGGTIT